VVAATLLRLRLDKRSPMSDLIALHWGSEKVTVVAPAKGRTQALVLQRPPAGDASAHGDWLKSQLAGRRLAGKRVAVVLPRSAAVFRKLTLPDLPDDELPDVVRMQAATKSATPLDRLRLDFVPLPRRGEGREALLATVPAKTIDDLLTTLRGAGLEPAAVGLSAFGMAAKVATSGEATLIVAIQDQMAEITLVRDGTVHFSHAADLPGENQEDDRQWLLSEVTRAVVAADHHAAAADLQRIVLLGPAELVTPLAPLFSERYGAPADLVVSHETLGVVSDDADVSPSAVAAALGQLDAAGPPRIDFLHPRKRVERPDRRRLYAAVAAGAVAAVLVLAYGVSWWKQSQLEDRVRLVAAQTSDLTRALTAGEPTLQAKRAVDEWSHLQADWAEQLALLDDALPGTDRLYLKDLRFDRGGRDDLGKITGQGFAKDRRDIEDFYEALASKGLLVAAKPHTESSQDPDYPRQFQLDVTIPKPAETARSTAAASPSA
jgi:Tfp pilus assembly protein PilN